MMKARWGLVSVVMTFLAGCGADGASESAEGEAAISGARVTPADVATRVDALKAQFRAADDGTADAQLTKTEAARAAGASFLERSYMLAQIEREYIALTTLDHWTTTAGDELVGVATAAGNITSRRAGETSKNARRLFAMTAAAPEPPESVTAAALDATVRELLADFTDLAGDTDLVRTEVLRAPEARLPATKRDFFLDVLENDTVPHPTLGQNTFEHWVTSASAELVAAGGTSISTTEALTCGDTARALWYLAATR